MFTTLINVIGAALLMTISYMYDVLFTKGLFIPYIIGLLIAPQFVGFLGTMAMIACFVFNLCIAAIDPASDPISAAIV